MFKMTEAFIRALEIRHIHYRIIKKDGEEDTIRISFSGDPILHIYFFFNEEKARLTVQVFDLVKGKKTPQLLELLNQLNEDYLFVKFYQESDGLSVHARIQAMITDETAAMIAVRMQGIMLGTCTEAYPLLSRAVI